jgi:hypothetical protein
MALLSDSSKGGQSLCSPGNKNPGQILCHGAVSHTVTKQACLSKLLSSCRGTGRGQVLGLGYLSVPHTASQVPVEAEDEDRSEDAKDQGTCLYLVQPLSLKFL